MSSHQGGFLGLSVTAVSFLPTSSAGPLKKKGRFDNRNPNEMLRQNVLWLACMLVERLGTGPACNHGDHSPLTPLSTPGQAGRRRRQFCGDVSLLPVSLVIASGVVFSSICQRSRTTSLIVRLQNCWTFVGAARGGGRGKGDGGRGAGRKRMD